MTDQNKMFEKRITSATIFLRGDKQIVLLHTDDRKDIIVHNIKMDSAALTDGKQNE